ncbi:MAG: ATPase, T2SS/T4P/T4SS family, partial [Planctomycetota bacterium]
MAPAKPKEKAQASEGADRASVSSEEAQAQRIAARLGIPYVDLADFPIDHDLFRTIPVDLMFRYNFIPWKEEEGRLVVVLSDPSDVLMVDELEILLGRPLRICVGGKTAINDVLKKSESSQRVLEAATEEFKIQVIRDSDEEGEEALSIDKLTQADSPIIKLVDSTVFNALQRRASDIHIETREREVIIKYRIDGVLYNAMDPIDKRFHSSIISRIKVMSELDIAEKRIPQDGRFKLKIKGRAIDFRVSIMP